MSKLEWKPSTMLYPIPAVMVSVADKAGNDNIITIAWTGIVCSKPPMLYISVKKERYSYHMLTESGEFVVNLTTEALTAPMDYCGVRSGRDVDKFAEMRLTREKAFRVGAPLIAESPVNLECRVTKVLELGTHDMFLAEIVSVDVDEQYLDQSGRFDLDRAHLVSYAHGSYKTLGETLGTFGYTVKKRKLYSQK